MGAKALMLTAVSAVALVGCYEDTTPTNYEPHVYKGAPDPLLGKLEQAELQSQLEARFETAARDR
ncbi:MAG: hypothetical protein U5K33_05810 [Halofilum sp. (in: g-proteobacteria)]|nr:hypothetical protein [Halofilum sp. (in: g-proteobacteria)]